MARTLVCSWCEHKWEIDENADNGTVKCPECGTEADPVVDSLEYKQNPGAFKSVIEKKTAHTAIVLPPTKDPQFYAGNPNALFLFATLEGTTKPQLEQQGGAILTTMSEYAGKKLAPLIVFRADDWMVPEGAGEQLEDTEAASELLGVALGVLMDRYGLSEEEVMRFVIQPWPDPYKVIFAYGP